jgi:hypothetical protein
MNLRQTNVGNYYRELLGANMHQNNISKQKNKHANSFILPSIVLKYSRNTPPNKILFGQSEESHTGEQMLQILAPKMG